MTAPEGPTPNGTVVIARLADGQEVDVTAGVQALYDLVIGSLDWGSGFLTVEDALPVVAIARTCGFQGFEEAERYVEAQRHSQEQQEFLRTRVINYRAPEHEHVWSSVGRCMWPQCKADRTTLDPEGAPPA